MNQTPATIIPPVLRQPGWQWTHSGLQVCSHGKRVLVPLGTLCLLLDQQMASEGVPQSASVGSPASVGGLFKKIRKAAKKFTKKVRRAVKKVAKVVKNVATHPAFRAGFAAVSTAFPVLAPAAAGLEVASRVIDKVEKGARAAKAIQKGVKTAKNLAAVKEGIKAKRAIETTVRKAQGGNTAAQRAYGAVIGAKVASRAARRRVIRGLPPELRPRKAWPTV